ncbi:DUF6986 family protein [Planomonospora algeriensis]
MRPRQARHADRVRRDRRGAVGRIPRRLPRLRRTRDVHALWSRHAELVRHSLRHGFYQGWDMHPSHLVSRYAAVYDFHLRHHAEFSRRVRDFQERRAAGGGVMDEPATVKTMSAALRRAELALGRP